MEFKEDAALITGGASGIGLATAQLLAERGVRVAIADIDDVAGEKAVNAIAARGGTAIFVRADVTSEASVQQLVDTTVQELGPIRYAFNNAGTAQAYTLTHEMDEGTFDKVFALNAKGVFLCMKAEISHMLAHGGGSIVNTASGAGTKAVAGMPAYVGSKHAVIGLTRNAAIEYVRDSIRVNAIAPGTVATPMITSMSADQQDLYAQAVPLGRLGTPEEIAKTAAFLLSEDSSFTTGTVLSIDGGFTQKQ